MTELEKAQARAKEINEKIEGLKGLVEEKATSKDIEEAIEKAFEGKSLKDIANQMVEIKELAEEAGLKVEEVAKAGAGAQERNPIAKAVKENWEKVQKAMASETEGKDVAEFTVKTLAQRSSVDSSLTYRDTELVPLDKRATPMSALFRHITVGPDSAGKITYIDWDTATTARAAAAVAEGAAFPESTVAWEENFVAMKKIGDSIPVTEEFTVDQARFAGEIEMFLGDNVELECDAQYLNGDGLGANLAGLDGSATAFTPVNRGITAPTLYDLVPVLRETIVKGKGAKYRPNYIMMNLTEINKYKLEKDANNNYIMPPFVSADGQVIDGIQVIENNLVADDVLYIGDSRHGRIYDAAEGYSLQIGYVNNQFLEDKKTLKARKRTCLLIKNSEKLAHYKVASIDAALTALAL
jgi:hypothetical protein